MNPILCSTGTFLGPANNWDYNLLESIANQLSCDGFEFMMTHAWYDQTDRLIDTLQASKLQFPVMHCQKSIGERISKGETDELREALRLFEINCRIARDIGAKKLVMHLWDGKTSDRNFQENAAAYPHLAEIAASYGLLLLIENVVCSQNDPMQHWRTLQNLDPNIRFVFDTKMAAFHGQMELLYQEDSQWLRAGHPICHYHVNDYGGGYMDWQNLRTLPMGQGHIDFARFFTYLREIGYTDTLTAEATALKKDGSVDTEMLNTQFQAMRKALFQNVAKPTAKIPE